MKSVLIIKGYVAVLHRSPSQNSLEFDNFILTFEMMLSDINSSNPHFSIIIGDFNVRSNNWWQGDTQTSEGSQIDYLTTSYGFQQLIPDPTHILKNSSSCIDLISTDQPNLITDSSTHLSLHPNCHHNITFCKINLKILHLIGDWCGILKELTFHLLQKLLKWLIGNLCF